MENSMAYRYGYYHGTQHKGCADSFLAWMEKWLPEWRLEEYLDGFCDGREVGE